MSLLKKSIHNLDASLEYLEETYFIIQNSFISDPIYHYESLDSLPVHFIIKTLDTITKKESDGANLNNYSSAYLALLVYSYFAGEDADRSINVSTFLPCIDRDVDLEIDPKTYQYIADAWDTLPVGFIELFVGSKWFNDFKDVVKE